jgi:hypothetical protein
MDGQLGKGDFTVSVVTQIRVQAGSQAGPAIAHDAVAGSGHITGNPNINVSDFYHISINFSTGIFSNGFTNLTLGGSGTYLFNNDITVLGNLIINGGAVLFADYDINVNGNLIINPDGTLSLSNSKTVTVGGTFTNNGRYIRH